MQPKMDEEELFSRLAQSGLPGSLNDLRNPTEEYVINLLKSFFNKFSIDADKIMQLSFEQLEALSVTSPENAPIASIINLREAIFSLGPQLFIKELSITDITTPVEKKFKNRLKLIVNFVIYAIQKKDELQASSEDILQRNILIDNLKQQKEKMIEEMNDKAARTAEKMASIEKMKIECETIKGRMEQRKPYIVSLEKDCHSLEQKKIQIREDFKQNKINIQKLSEKNESLKSKIVKSPSKYKQCLRELEEELTEKEAGRKNMENKIVTNNAKVQQLNDALDYVQKEQEKLVQFKETFVKLTNANEKIKQLEKLIENATKEIKKEETRKEQNEKVDTTEVSKCNAEVNNKIKKLNKILGDLILEKKIIEKNFEVERSNENKICIEMDQGKLKIAEVESEIEDFLKQCQELYSTEMKKLVATHAKIDPNNLK